MLHTLQTRIWRSGAKRISNVTILSTLLSSGKLRISFMCRVVVHGHRLGLTSERSEITFTSTQNFNHQDYAVFTQNHPVYDYM
jgi:hypothetical protein